MKDIQRDPNKCQCASGRYELIQCHMPKFGDTAYCATHQHMIAQDVEMARLRVSQNRVS